MLQWARANGCPWNNQTCAAAAVGGHLEVLQWVYKNGCPRNRSACMTIATHYEHPDVVAWLNEHVP